MWRCLVSWWFCILKYWILSQRICKPKFRNVSPHFVTNSLKLHYLLSAQEEVYSVTASSPEISKHASNQIYSRGKIDIKVFFIKFTAKKSVEEEGEARTCLVVIVDFDHRRFQVPDWLILLQRHAVDLRLVLPQLKSQNTNASFNKQPLSTRQKLQILPNLIPLKMRLVA